MSFSPFNPTINTSASSIEAIKNPILCGFFDSLCSAANACLNLKNRDVSPSTTANNALQKIEISVIEIDQPKETPTISISNNAEKYVPISWPQREILMVSNGASIAFGIFVQSVVNTAINNRYGSGWSSLISCISHLAVEPLVVFATQILPSIKSEANYYTIISNLLLLTSAKIAADFLTDSIKKTADLSDSEMALVKASIEGTFMGIASALNTLCISSIKKSKASYNKIPQSWSVRKDFLKNSGKYRVIYIGLMRMLGGLINNTFLMLPAKFKAEYYVKLPQFFISSIPIALSPKLFTASDFNVVIAPTVTYRLSTIQNSSNNEIKEAYKPKLESESESESESEC